MTEHSPISWKVKEDTFNFVIVDKDGTIVVEYIINEANARFIVAACNNYERLLEALAEHSIYFLAADGEELFDQPLNWEAILLQEIRKVEEQIK